MKVLQTFIIFAVVVFFSVLEDAEANGRYRKLVKKLKTRLGADYVPFGPNLEGVNVSMSIDLLGISEVSAHKNEMAIEVMLTLNWNAGISWNAHKYHVHQVRIQASDMWTPDITTYNGFQKFENQAPSIVIIDKTGMATYVPRGRLDAKCDISPNRVAVNETCVFKLGSWTYDGNQLRLKEPTGDVVVNDFNSGKYNLLGATLVKQTQLFPCCPEPYQNYALTISFAKKSSGDM